MKERKLYEHRILYHFCPDHLWPSIKKKGLRLGKIPTGESLPNSELFNVKLIHGYQWLTLNPEFKQSWNEGSSLPYDRTSLRLTICLPKAELFNLFKWTEFGKTNPLYETLSSFGDPENWYLFKGVIIPYWIINVNHKNNNQ